MQDVDCAVSDQYLRILYKLSHCISMFVLHCYGKGSHSIVHVILLVHLHFRFGTYGFQENHIVSKSCVVESCGLAGFLVHINVRVVQEAQGYFLVVEHNGNTQWSVPASSMLSTNGSLHGS